MTSEKIRLFALLIGVNKYKVVFGDLRPLSGAVPDALLFKMYLEKCLGVPETQITLLTDEEATRSNIINALKALREDERIDKDDAIFMYYAGHGTEIDPPKERIGDKPGKIQAIVPYDCDHVNEAGMRVPPIPDYVLEILLSKIVEEKGDNITVVFDCCHSASGTRGIRKPNTVDDEITRSVEIKSSAVYSEQLDEEILEIETVARGASVASKLSHRGLGSHILLSACEASEEAKEDGGHGRFSSALLKLLNEVSVDTLRYSDILKHPKIDKIYGQNPQCEGRHLGRSLFNSKVLPAQRKAFDIDDQHGQYIVRGGTIHNIQIDSEFGVYRKTDLSFSAQIGTLEVDNLQPFYFKAKLPPNAPPFDFTEPLIAAQTKFGKHTCLRIYIPPGNGFHKVFDEMMQNAELNRHLDPVERVGDSADCQVAIASSIDKKFTFTLSTPAMVPNQVTMVHKQVVDSEEVGQNGLAWLFPKMAHFYRELRYTNIEPRIAKFIDIELYRLQDEYRTNEDTGYEEDIFVRVSPNLCVNNMVNLHIPDEEAENVPYGIRIVNRSALGLYANVFHFNTHDLSISSFAEAHIGHTDNGPDIPLKEKGGILDIGFGQAGYQPISFEIPSGLDMDIGYLKIYLSTKPVRLAYLPQSSPFSSTRGIKTFVPKPTVIWTNIVVPIILRRNLQAAPVSVERN